MANIKERTLVLEKSRGWCNANLLDWKCFSLVTRVLVGGSVSNIFSGYVTYRTTQDEIKYNRYKSYLKC